MRPDMSKELAAMRLEDLIRDATRARRYRSRTHRSLFVLAWRPQSRRLSGEFRELYAIYAAAWTQMLRCFATAANEEAA